MDPSEWSSRMYSDCGKCNGVISANGWKFTQPADLTGKVIPKTKPGYAGWCNLCRHRFDYWGERNELVRRDRRAKLQKDVDEAPNRGTKYFAEKNQRDAEAAYKAVDDRRRKEFRGAIESTSVAASSDSYESTQVTAGEMDDMGDSMTSWSDIGSTSALRQGRPAAQNSTFNPTGRQQSYFPGHEPERIYREITAYQHAGHPIRPP